MIDEMCTGKTMMLTGDGLTAGVCDIDTLTKSRMKNPFPTPDGILYICPVSRCVDACVAFGRFDGLQNNDSNWGRPTAGFGDFDKERRESRSIDRRKHPVSC